MKPDMYWISGPRPGKLAISSRPRGGDWLEDEIRGWREAKVNRVISLLEKDEERQLELDGESRLAESAGVRFVSFPVQDRGVPASVDAAVSLLQSINQALERGENVAVHCRQGIGRAAVVAAGVLMASGASADEAIEVVRKARGLIVPETKEQGDWLRRELADSLAVVHR